MFLMPLEVAWNATVTWRGGDLLCRVMAFFRIFGLFLSSFVLVCLAVDRYMAVRFPMQSLSGVRRSRQMIALSWILSVFCSSPQVVFFQVEHHPVFTWYTQCVVYSSLPTKTHTFAYFLFGMFFTYLGPFIIILILYCGIVIELIKRHKESKGQMNSRNGGDGLRRSGIGNIGKAKEKALKMTAVIIIVFFVCWTPYFLISLWYFIDEDSFSQLDPKINKALFFFACTNSTANPVVYGIFRLKSNTDTLRRDNNGGTLRQGISGESLCQRHLHSNNSFRMSEVTQDQSVTIYTPRKSTINVSIMQQPKESQGCNLAVTASTSNHAIKGVLTPSYV
ncbi:Gonadotropin-releasing hormone II receptor [Folsomia candida]|uniref:Gonadotropin-releasing hormone II receptor n=2 Tax=Folsomia candida TaxID=158441 RepID=A0A226EUV0_FOLCA|nr:Gonadotropin-releasing hormone II receptor [Folsomia candida]